jgi:hypothetical protein
MDEKGFFVGIAPRSKRVFSKTVWQLEKLTKAIKDSNREWVTLIACVCASRESLPPALIYQGTSRIQLSWVDDVEVGQHQVFFFNSPTGFSNNELRLAWFERVFERHTKSKARRGWRLLVLDGHSSHLTPDFTEFCDANRILVMVFPPHSTHRLQPLGVVLFSPLSKNYTNELNYFLQRSQCITRITRRDFFDNFCASWSSTMKPELIIRVFKLQACGPWSQTRC